MTASAAAYTPANFTGVNSRSHLVATPIVDSRGKQTTVYRLPQGAAAGQRPMPTPMVAAAHTAAPPERSAYEQRLAGIAAANEIWKTESRCEGLDQLKMDAIEALSNLMVSMAVHGGGVDNDAANSFAERVGGTTSQMEYGRLIAANALAPLYHAFADDDSETDPTDAEAREEALDNDYYGWAPQYLTGVVTVVERLQNLDLQARHDVPSSPDDDRFSAHLYASAREAINYAANREGDDFIRLIDERPNDVEAIVAGIERGLHPEAVRAVIDGATVPAVAAGAL